MEYTINQIFYDDEDYSNKVDFCNTNNLQIIEIGPDEKGRRFKIVEQIKPTNDPTTEMQALKVWFNDYYTVQEQKLRRLHTLGKLTDDGQDPYQALINLYNLAEVNRARIQELEALIG